MPAPLKFIVDESSGGAVVEALRQLGHDVLSVAEEMKQASDEDILNIATKDQRILITNDKDFGELIYRGWKSHSGVILLRLSDESPANRVRVLKAAIKKYVERLPGNFIVVTEKKIRIRSGRLI